MCRCTLNALFHLYTSFPDRIFQMKKGANDLAIKYYKKSIVLNPENTNAKEILKRLEKNK